VLPRRLAALGQRGRATEQRIDLFGKLTRSPTMY
jgi:hypothetical protein